MALTLIEAAKLNSGDVIRAAIIELYARNSDILRVLPFDDIEGNALKYNREDKLPGIGFRGVNESYSESVGILNPITESLVIAGGDLDVDKFIVRTMGANQRSTHEAMKVRALALRWTKAFLKGNSASDPREFDGLQNRLIGTQLIDNNTGVGALSLAKLDEAIDAVNDPTHLVMNKTMRRRLSQAARSASVGGYITFDLDEFGRKVSFYNDLPILIADEDEAGDQILPFTEAGSASGTTGTSIYCVSFGDGKVTGIQNGGIMVDDLGEIQTKPVMRTRVEWYSGLCCYHGKSASRLMGVADAAVVA